MTFVDYVRQFLRESEYGELEHAIELAIDRCIGENVLREFLMKHRTEVVKVMRLDYTFDRQLMLERADSREEGREEEKEKIAVRMLQTGKLTMEEIAEYSGLEMKKIKELAEKRRG